MGNPDLRPKDTNQRKAEALRAKLPDDEETARLARQAQVLGDPTRLSILLLLREAGSSLEAGELCVSDLCLIIEREQGGVSRHLKIALDAGLVTRHRLDLWAMYALTERAKELLATLLGSSEK
jgi:DNA-binding transcriptional ArsR family regulator